MATLNELPVGTIVCDQSFIHDFQGFGYGTGSASYDASRRSPEAVRWVIINQDRVNGSLTTLMAESPLYFSQYFGPMSEEFKYSFVNSLLNAFTGQSLFMETPQRFRDAIVPVSINYLGTIHSDVKYYILSQTEMGGGSVGITGNHGTEIPYFAGTEGRKKLIPKISRMTLERGNVMLTRSDISGGPGSQRVVRNILPGQTPTFETASSPAGIIVPVVNLRSDISVSTFDVMGARLLFDTGLEALTRSLNIKEDGEWKPVPRMAIKTESIWR